jgi:hypothetical protein
MRLALVGSLIVTVVAGCSTGEPPVDERGATSSKEIAGTSPNDAPAEKASPSASSSSCGNYEAKQCDPQTVVNYVKNQDADDTLNTVIGCTECGAALVAAGAVASWAVTAPPVLVGLGELFALVKTSSDCQQCLKFSVESGLAEVLSCAFAPCKYSEEGNQKDCEQSAPEGQYGFKNRGNFLCSYTTDPTEAECQMKCFEGTHIVKEDSGKCWCKTD